MRMVGKSRDVIVGIVAAKRIQHQERIEASLQLACEHPGQRHAGAVRCGDTCNEALDAARLVQ